MKCTKEEEKIKIHQVHTCYIHVHAELLSVRTECLAHKTLAYYSYYSLLYFIIVIIVMDKGDLSGIEHIFLSVSSKKSNLTK